MDDKFHSPSTDSGFRLAIVISTAVIFATAFGWLGCIQRKETGEVEFHWQWGALFWIAIGISCTVYFWRQIWPIGNTFPTGTKKRMVKGWAALLIPSLMWMTYPLLFVSGQQLLNVSIGLAIAVTVLTLGGWMVFRLVKGFANEDEETPPVKVDLTGTSESEIAIHKKALTAPPEV